MRNNPRRQLNTATLTLQQLRSIGDWGGASRSIGQRWEVVGLSALREGIAGAPPLAVVALCEDPSVQQRLGKLGLPNPDALIVEPGADDLVVRPADLKWALDVASYHQISGANLTDLLQVDPPLAEAIRKSVPAQIAALPLRPADGYFVCPDATANRRFLTSPQNQRQEYPLEAQEVVFVPVNVQSFFGPLPGWYTAQQIARLDGALAALRNIDAADRYYHIGAGVNGALALRGRSIFDEEPPTDGDEAVRWSALSAEIRPLTASNVLSRLDAEMRHRRELIQRLRAVRRCPYTFREFVEDLQAAGLLDTGVDPEPLWGPQYGEVARGHAGAVMVAGRALIARGQSDAQALASLEQRTGEFAARARARARALMQSTLQEGVTGDGGE